MNLNLEQLSKMVDEVISEAKKKKEKAEDLKSKAGTAGAAYGSYAEAFDFSAPLGGYNLYKSQGAVNWGPMTSAGTKLNSNVSGMKGMEENVLRAAIRDMISEKVSAWETLAPIVEDRRTTGDNIWESLQHWYDHTSLGLGNQTTEGIIEKKEKMARAAKKGRK